MASWTSPGGRSEFLAKTMPAAPGPHSVSHMGRSIGAWVGWSIVEPREVLTPDEIDLSDTEFWARPWDEREGAFRRFRRNGPWPSPKNPRSPRRLS